MYWVRILTLNEYEDGETWQTHHPMLRASGYNRHYIWHWKIIPWNYLTNMTKVLKNMPLESNGSASNIPLYILI